MYTLHSKYYTGLIFIPRLIMCIDLNRADLKYVIKSVIFKTKPTTTGLFDKVPAIWKAWMQ